MANNNKITNPKLLKVLSNNDYMLMGDRKGKKLEYNNYHGKCTSGPGGWYAQAGITLNWWNGIQPVTYQNSHSRLESCGMIPVWHGTLSELNSLTSDNLRPGDVATLYTGRTGHQHGEMWTGHDWRSDTIQVRASCYSSSNQGEWSAVIWRHPDLQQSEWGDIKNMNTKVGNVDFSNSNSFTPYDWGGSNNSGNNPFEYSNNLNRGSNRVTRLSSASNMSENDGVADNRSDAFMRMVNDFTENAPEFDREIIVASEMNGSEILNNGQESKSKNGDNSSYVVLGSHIRQMV